MRQAVAWVLVGTACLVAARSAAAQGAARTRPEEVFQRSFFFEREIRERLEANVPSKQTTLIEYGGFYVPSYSEYTDIDDGMAHVTQQDLRLWLQAQFDEVHRVFARMKLSYTDYASGDAHGFRAHDLDGPDLDVGYYELDLTAAVDKYGGQKWPVRIKARGGRQYIEVGRGIALGDTLDVGSFDVEAKDFSFTAFAGRTPRGRENIDRSAPGYPHSRRTFYGLEAKYRGIERHEPYYFFVWQRDWSEEKPQNPGQDYRYSSHYHGIGSRGEVIPSLLYEIESLWEFGRSPANGQVGRGDHIQAYAFDSQLDYYVPCGPKPIVSVEYAYASGDGDRQSATTAALGSRPGSMDTAFLGFGYVNSGLALGARFTNIQFVRLGGRITAYENKASLGRVDVGANLYWQMKTDHDGPISDARAVTTSHDIGKEIDMFVEWRILSDLALSVHYGRFKPGGAYVSRDARDFLFTALTFSF